MERPLEHQHHRGDRVEHGHPVVGTETVGDQLVVVDDRRQPEPRHQHQLQHQVMDLIHQAEAEAEAAAEAAAVKSSAQ